MTVHVRFAPSPTGKLHVGNIKTAIITWLFAKSQSGKFFLRIDDTDLERSRDEFSEAIKRDLLWLGMQWDDMAHQKDRRDVYDKAIQKLKDDGRLYPCYETAEELNLKRKTQLARGNPPIYDRASLSLSADQIKAYHDEGRKPHWRFKMEHKPIIWQDLVRGEVSFNGADMSDPVLIREDGTPLYHICSVVDDIDFKITHIIRGEDHVSNTASHIQMFEALGLDTQLQFAHLPLISDSSGGKLSKRLGSLSIEELRDDLGFEPITILNYLARLGTSDPIEVFSTPEPLINSFSFSKFSRGAPKFDADELPRLNAKLLHHMDYQQAEPHLIGRAKNEQFWLIVRENINTFKDIKSWLDMIEGDITPLIIDEDRDYINLAIENAPPAPWTESSWAAWTNQLKTLTDRKGKSLFMPLRKALTGKEHGPDMSVLCAMIGYDKAMQRLK
jgi:glutamyl-tRNA synthetase